MVVAIFRIIKKVMQVDIHTKKIPKNKKRVLYRNIEYSNQFNSFNRLYFKAELVF